MKAYTSKAVAKWLDISERRVRQLRDEKVITEIRPGLYDLKTVNHQYINYLRKNNPESESAIDYNAERAKLVRAKEKHKNWNCSCAEMRYTPQRTWNR